MKNFEMKNGVRSYSSQIICVYYIISTKIYYWILDSARFMKIGKDIHDLNEFSCHLHLSRFTDIQKEQTEPFKAH